MSQRLTPEVLVYDTVTAADPQLSPDGSQVVYSLARVDREQDRGTSQLWVCDVDGGRPRQLTWTGDRNREPRWSSDGRFIAFVSDRVQGSSALLVLPMQAPGEAQEVTRHRQALGHLAWSLDSARIAYTTTFDPDNPDEQPPPEGRAPKVRVTRRLDYKQDNRGWLNDTRTQVFVVEVASGERRRLTGEPHDLWYPQWSPDGQWLAARVTTDNGIYSRLAIIDAATGATRRVGPESGSVTVWSWSPGADRILFAGDTEPTAGVDLFLYSLKEDTIRRLTTDLPCAPDAGFPTVLGPSQPVWLDESEVLFHAVRGGESGIYRFNVESLDLESMYGTSDISHAWGPLEWGGKPHEASEAFAAHSPSTFAHRATTPTLIVQGEADERCPIGQGEQMFVALKQAGCEVEFARYPGGAHAMLRVGPPSHRADFLQRLVGWFTEHLSG